MRFEQEWETGKARVAEIVQTLELPIGASSRIVASFRTISVALFDEMA